MLEAQPLGFGVPERTCQLLSADQLVQPAGSRLFLTSLSSGQQVINRIAVPVRGGRVKLRSRHGLFGFCAG